jgi:polyhydroxyalkanoate synthesis regulator phasin
MARSQNARPGTGKKGSKNRGERGADTVRAAVERTFQATAGQAQMTRERAQELVDDLSGATSRVREVLDDLRVATGEDVKALEHQIRKLERRVAALEKDAKPARRRSPAKRSPAKRATAE